MVLLIRTTFFVCLTCFLMKATSRPKYNVVSEYEDPHCYNTILIWILAGLLIFVEGFVYSYGDGLNYRYFYGEVPNSLVTIWRTTKSPGWYTIQWLFKLFSNNIRLLYIFLALFFTITDFKFIKKYSVDLPFSLLLYYLFYFLPNLNGIRQMLTANILLLAFPWIIKKNYFKYIILIVILSTIHKSVLIMIPLLFVFGGKRWNIGVIAIVVFCFFSAFFPGVINTLIGIFFSDEYADFRYDVSANIMHVLVAVVPFALGIIYHRANRENVGEYRAMDILINMQAISFGFTILAINMAQYIRIGWYMKNSGTIVTPFLVANVFGKRDAKFIRTIAIILYIAQFIIIYIIKAPAYMYKNFYLDFSIFGF